MTEALAPTTDSDASATPTTAMTADPDAGLRQLAAGTFGLPRLRDGQLAGMRALIAGRDVLAVMPTGYGKSASTRSPRCTCTETSLRQTTTKQTQPRQTQPRTRASQPAQGAVPPSSFLR